METKTNYEFLINKLENNKEKLVMAACGVLIFIVGFGTGRAEQAMKMNDKAQVNYTTNQGDVKSSASSSGQGNSSSNSSSTEKPAAASNPSLPVPANPDVTNCPVKGNVSGSKKTYHVPGGSFYERTNPEQCFSTEEEALASGFVKSSR